MGIDLSHYKQFFDAVQGRVKSARGRVANAAQSETIQLYWWIGEQIVENQARHNWGKSIVEQLSKDLRQAFPGAKFGFSPQNLWYMRKFYLEYKEFKNLQRLVGEIPWSHNLLIMTRVKGEAERSYYLAQTKEQGWSRDTLSEQIKSNAYARRQIAENQHNFKDTLPADVAKKASESIKDIYVFDMLNIAEPVIEIEIERQMVAKIKEVLLELGVGFSFIGNQYRIETPDSEYFIDLLFYHRKLQSLVAIELKRGKFTPEHAGKMNFYLNLLDDFVKEPHESPSIGIILCGDHTRFDVEYALRGIDKPVGVSGYQLTKDIPDRLKDALPDATKLEEKIQFELGLCFGEDSDE